MPLASVHNHNYMYLTIDSIKLTLPDIAQVPHESDHVGQSFFFITVVCIYEATTCHYTATSPTTSTQHAMTSNGRPHTEYCTWYKHNALPYSESSYLSTNTDISMSLEQQLNYCHMAFPWGPVECCLAILYNGIQKHFPMLIASLSHGLQRERLGKQVVVQRCYIERREGWRKRQWCNKEDGRDQWNGGMTYRGARKEGGKKERRITQVPLAVQQYSVCTNYITLDCWLTFALAAIRALTTSTWPDSEDVWSAV